MLTIYPAILETIEMLRPMMGRIDRHDRDLGRQLRRAASSVALGVAEGMYSRGGKLDRLGRIVGTLVRLVQRHA